MKAAARRRAARAACGFAVAAAYGSIAAAVPDPAPALRTTSIATAFEAAAATCAARADGGAAAAAETAAAPFTEALLYTAPRLAFDRACRALAGTPAADAALGVDRLLDLAESALAAGDVGVARRLLESLLAAVGDTADVLSGDRLARLHVDRADLANAEIDNPLALRHVALARAALDAAGLRDTLRHVRVWVGEASGRREEGLPGALEEAGQTLDRATALLVVRGEAVSLDMSRVLNERTMLAYSRRDLAGTVDAARAEVALYRQLGLGDSSAPLDALVTLGGVLSQLGRSEEAEIELREALRLVDLHPGEQPSAALGALNNYTALLSEQGRLVETLAAADRALAYAQQAFGRGAARTLMPLTRRSQALSRLARYGEARRSFEEALAVTAVHAAGVGPQRRLQLQDNLAATLMKLGETAAADELIEQGLRETAALEGLDYWRGRLARLRAAMAARREDWPTAEAAAADAIVRIGAANGERHPYVVDIGSVRCFAQTQGRLPGRACDELAAALPVLDSAPAGYRFNAMAALAQDEANRGRADAALARRLQALAAAESAGTPDPLWSAYAALAAAVRERGARQLAVLLGKQAVDQIERMRGSLDGDAKRLERGFLADKLGVYRRLAAWLTEDGRIDEALDVVRLLKEEEFLDFVNRDGSLLGRTDRGPVYADAEAPLQRAWRGPDTASAAGRGADTDADAVIRRENERVAQWLGLLSAAPERPAAAAPPIAAAAPPIAAAATEPHAAPPAHEARVWIYPGDRRLHVVIDGPSRRTTFAVDASPAEIAGLVADLLGAIERREPVLGRLQALHARVAAPIEQAAAADGVRRLVLTVDGPLRYLPFAALHDGRGFLGERYGVEQRVPMPAPAVATAGPARTVASLRVQAMGVSRTVGGMAPLKAVASEVCGIVAGPVLGLALDGSACGPAGIGRGVMRGSGWMNDEFTAERLQTAVADGRRGRGEASLLHIGTHFVLRPGRMSRSWLLLGDGRPLSLEDLGRIDFRGQSLVTLSACETGIGSAQGGSGEEIDGLGGLMLRRGAGGVVASLWRVDDASTSLLMQAFYRRLAAGAEPAEALRQAQARLREAGGRSAHPFYWAGFYLVTGAR